MTNLTDLAIDSLTMGVLNTAPTTESLSSNGAINIKSGVVLLTKSDGALTMTLANPTATTDDYKRLTIASTSARGHTVAIATTGFGNAGASKIKATFSGVVGDTLDLMAYGGYWYVTGFHQVTFGTA
jgi:hypothetical protein